MFVSLCVCVISNQSTSNLDTLLHKTHKGPYSTKVPKFDMCRSIFSLSKIARQMWCDHPFSHQRYRATQRTVRVKVVGDREVG